MSLIQEALRRKDNQDQGTMAIPPKQVPPVIQIPQPQPEKKSKAWLVLAISILSLLLLIIAALGLLVYSAQHLVKTGGDYQSVSSRGAPVPPPSIPRPAIKAIKPVFERTTGKSTAQPVSPPLEPVVAKDERALRPVPVAPPPEAKPEERKIMPPASSARQSASLRRVKREPISEPQPKQKKTVARNQVKTEQVMVPKSSGWPKLSLLGVMARETPGTGSAIINNMVIEIGEEVAGVRLLEVQRNGILLEFNGETQFVRVGQSTY